MASFHIYKQKSPNKAKNKHKHHFTHALLWAYTAHNVGFGHYCQQQYVQIREKKVQLKINICTKAILQSYISVFVKSQNNENGSVYPCLIGQQLDYPSLIIRSINKA